MICFPAILLQRLIFRGALAKSDVQRQYRPTSLLTLSHIASQVHSVTRFGIVPKLEDEKKDLWTVISEIREKKGNVRKRYSCNHCCSGRLISITYSECVSLALCIQHAMRMRHVVICGLLRSTIFFDIISKTARFSKKNRYWTWSGVSSSSTTSVRNISHCKKKWERYNKKCILVFTWSNFYSFPILMKLEFSRKMFRKIIKYQILWKSVRWELSCSVRRDGQTDRLDESNSHFSQFCDIAKREYQRIVT